MLVLVLHRGAVTVSCAGEHNFTTGRYLPLADRIALALGCVLEIGLRKSSPKSANFGPVKSDNGDPIYGINRR